MVYYNPLGKQKYTQTSWHGDQMPYGKHRGVDLAVPINTKVYASAEGKIRYYDDDGGGIWIMIDHPDGSVSGYAHLKHRAVNDGTNVKAGQFVAYSGNSGKWTTGAHLHWQIKKGNGYIDPQPYLKNTNFNSNAMAQYQEMYHRAQNPNRIGCLEYNAPGEKYPIEWVLDAPNGVPRKRKIKIEAKDGRSLKSGERYHGYAMYAQYRIAECQHGELSEIKEGDLIINKI